MTALCRHANAFKNVKVAKALMQIADFNNGRRLCHWVGDPLITSELGRKSPFIASQSPPKCMAILLRCIRLPCLGRVER